MHMHYIIDYLHECSLSVICVKEVTTDVPF